jgi:hypothetical protein
MDFLLASLAIMCLLFCFFRIWKKINFFRIIGNLWTFFSPFVGLPKKHKHRKQPQTTANNRKQPQTPQTTAKKPRGKIIFNIYRADQIRCPPWNLFAVVCSVLGQFQQTESLHWQTCSNLTHFLGQHCMELWASFHIINLVVAPLGKNVSYAPV